jgi:hypothetical protein
MVKVGLRRVALGTLAGGVVWGIWSTIINMVVLMPKYKLAQDNQLMLSQPRYPCCPNRVTRCSYSIGL